MYIEEFINYLSSEKRFSEHTIISYSIDINQFWLFLSKEYKISSEIFVFFIFISFIELSKIKILFIIYNYN